MPDSKISALAAATSLASTDEFVIATGGASKKVTMETLLASLPIVRIFDSTLTEDAASFDTGTNGVPATFDHLMILAYLRTSEVVVISSGLLRYNGDSSAIYDRIAMRTINVTVTGATTLAGTSFAIRCPGDSNAANAFGVVRIFIPAYAQTTGHKIAEATATWLDTAAANSEIDATSGRWRSTAAINQISLASGSGNFRTGSRLTIYGLN